MQRADFHSFLQYGAGRLMAQRPAAVLLSGVA
jgi:hypothetical protein